MRTFFFVFLLFFTAFSSQAQLKKKAKNKAHRVVIQLAQGDTLSQFGLLNNLENLRSGWPELEIEVVCHGPGLSLLHLDKSHYLAKVEAAQKQGVVFVACRNTMKVKKVPDEKILSTAVRVDMGLKQVIERQEQGWSYLKAGVTPLTP